MWGTVQLHTSMAYIWQEFIIQILFLKNAEQLKCCGLNWKQMKNMERKGTWASPHTEWQNGSMLWLMSYVLFSSGNNFLKDERKVIVFLCVFCHRCFCLESGLWGSLSSIQHLEIQKLHSMVQYCKVMAKNKQSVSLKSSWFSCSGPEILWTHLKVHCKAWLEDRAAMKFSVMHHPEAASSVFLTTVTMLCSGNGAVALQSLRQGNRSTREAGWDETAFGRMETFSYSETVYHSGMNQWMLVIQRSTKAPYRYQAAYQSHGIKCIVAILTKMPPIMSINEARHVAQGSYTLYWQQNPALQ